MLCRTERRRDGNGDAFVPTRASERRLSCWCDRRQLGMFLFDRLLQHWHRCAQTSTGSLHSRIDRVVACTRLLLLQSNFINSIWTVDIRSTLTVFVFKKCVVPLARDDKSTATDHANPLAN